jgi:hypothetical protein
MECEERMLRKLRGDDVIIIVSEEIAFVRSDGGGRNTKATEKTQHLISMRITEKKSIRHVASECYRSLGWSRTGLEMWLVLSMDA